MNLIKIFDLFKEDGKYFIIMEYCIKGDMKTLIETKKEAA